MADPEVPHVVCAPTTRPPLVPAERRDAECGHEVWVSKKALPSYPPDAEFVCVNCVVMATNTEVSIPDSVLREVAENRRNGNGEG